MGYNLPVLDYFYSTYPFLDVGKTGGGFYPVVGTVASYDANDFPTLNVGCTVRHGLTLGLDNNYGYFPPGSYEIVTTDAPGSNLWVTPPAVGTGVPTSTAGYGRATFTAVDATSNWGAMTMTFDIRNDSGSPVALTNIRVSKISDAAAIAAGNIYRPEFIAAHAPCKVIRIHDWQFTDNPHVAWEAKFSDLFPTGSDEGRAVYIQGKMPVSIGMKFAKAVQDYQGSEVRPWINVPCGIKHFWWAAFTDTSRICAINGDDINEVAPRIKPHNLANGEKFVFCDVGTGQPGGVNPLVKDTIYFVVNATTTTFQLALTSGGSPVTLTPVGGTTAATSDYDPTTYGSVISRTPPNGYVRGSGFNIDPYNDMILPWLTACHAAWPTSRPMIEMGGENWNTNFPVWNWLRIVPSYITTGGFGSPASGHAWLHLLAWKAAESLWGVGNFTMIHPAQGSYPAILGGSFDFVDGGYTTAVRHSGQDLKTQYINALAVAGSGPTDTIPAVVYSVGGYVANTAYSEANYPAHGIGFSILGDAYVANGNSAAVPDSYWDTRFDEEIGGLAPVLTSDISYARGKVPNMPFVLYEWGQQIAYTGSANAAAVGANYVTYLDSTAGKNMYQRFYENTLAPQGFYAICHYTSVGGRFVNNSQFFAWNVIPPNMVDTPRSAYLKTI